MEKSLSRVRVNTMRELDALVGEHLTGEVPEVYWEDAHAVFRFETEEEALEALKRLKSQPSLPKVNWESVTVTKIKSYRLYSSDIATAWSVVEKIAGAENGLRMRREGGMWHVSFGHHGECVARSASVAICVAGLRTVNIEVVFDPDRIH
jgi:hypothetical protein